MIGFYCLETSVFLTSGLFDFKCESSFCYGEQLVRYCRASNLDDKDLWEMNTFIIYVQAYKNPLSLHATSKLKLRSSVRFLNCFNFSHQGLKQIKTILFNVFWKLNNSNNTSIQSMENLQFISLYLNWTYHLFLASIWLEHLLTM